jgi:hypothetical protein
MARRLTPKQIFEAIIGQMEPRLATAFRRAINGIRARVNYARLVEQLTGGRVEEAVAGLGIDPVAYEGLIDTFRAEYVNAGRVHISGLPGQAGELLFAGRNPRAEAWLEEHSSELITGIVDDQRNAVRATLTEGMARGVAPRSLASRIVGPVARANATREGGILGLSAPQAEWVGFAREELASGRLGNYFKRERRNHQLDAKIRRALREGSIPPELIESAVRAYEKRLLTLRGQTIARTESMTGLHAAQWEGLLQLVDAGTVVEQQIERVWRDSRDLRVRHTHASLNGQRVGLFEKFTSVSGAQLQYPGDPKAPVGERVNCRCWAETVIDFYFDLT